MDLVIKFLNVVLPPITLILLCFILPSYLVFKFLSCIKGYLFSENLAGKVVLITGASSGIGEYLAYEYGRRGARLALVARREDRLHAVADKARQLGSTDVIVISADVSKVEDCKRFIDETTNHFGRLDHLVTNAGIVQATLFQDSTPISDFHPIMSTNFWGSVYATQFAIPHLRKSKGKIVVISPVGAYLPTPRMSVYNASKGALVSFFDTLRVEVSSDIGITIVTPGLVDSEITDPKFRAETNMDLFVAESTEACARAIVEGTRRGKRYVTEPSFYRVFFPLKVLYPELLDWLYRLIFIYRLHAFKKNV